jgi:hypothetical protein
MMRVTAKATRNDGWWAVEVPEVVGLYTQARRLDQVAEMVVDAAALLGVELAPDEVDVAPVLGPAAQASLNLAAGLRDESAITNTDAAAAMRLAAHELSAAGWTLRDIGVALGVSHQRVHQLVGDADKDALIEQVTGSFAYLRQIRERTDRSIEAMSKSYESTR